MFPEECIGHVHVAVSPTVGFRLSAERLQPVDQELLTRPETLADGGQFGRTVAHGPGDARSTRDVRRGRHDVEAQRAEGRAGRHGGQRQLGADGLVPNQHVVVLLHDDKGAGGHGRSGPGRFLRDVVPRPPSREPRGASVQRPRGPACVEPGLPEACPPLAPVVLGLSRSCQIRGYGVGDLVMHLEAVGLEVDGSDERVVRQVRVEQGAVVVVRAPAGGRLRLVRARCIQDDGAQLRAGMRIRCASHRIDAHQGDGDHRQRRECPRYHGEPQSPRSLVSHGLRLAHGVCLRRVTAPR